MNRPTSSGTALIAATVATFLALLFCAVAPAAATGQAVKSGDAIVVHTYVPGVQDHSAIAKRRDGKFVAVWQDHGIQVQLLNANFTRVFENEMPVNTATHLRQLLPRVSVAPKDNSFVVTWEGDTDFPIHWHSVFSQRYDGNGTKVGSVLRVPSQLLDKQASPDVAHLTNGNIAFVWRDLTSGYRIATRVFDGHFNPLISDVDVGSGEKPRIAALSGGGYVVVFGHGDTDAYGRIFASNGTSLGGSFRLNTYTTSHQVSPVVAGLPNGGFVAAWDSVGQDGDGHGIFAQRFLATGEKFGDEFQVHTHTAAEQEHPTIGAFSDNSFVVSWLGETARSGGESRVVLQYFDANAAKVGEETDVAAYDGNVGHALVVATNIHDFRFALIWHDFGTFSIDVFAQSFAGPPPPAIALECTTACLEYVCVEGTVMRVRVKGVAGGTVWGSTHFSDDSNVATAAVFAGLVRDGEVGVVAVKCTGPKPSFTGGFAHNVTTLPYNRSWPASFTFDLGEGTWAPAATPNRCTREPCAINHCHVHGTFFDMIVKGVASNDVWGSDVYSDDSWLGAAAVQQGLVQPGSTGVVSVSCSGRREVLEGTTRSGITSQNYGAWRFTFVLSGVSAIAPTSANDVCAGACLSGKCETNTEVFVRVYGSTLGYVWGSGPFTEDSSVAAAAVHAGLVAKGAIAIVKATCEGPHTAYTASTYNNVTARSDGPYPSSYRLAHNAGMPTVICLPGVSCLADRCAVSGSVFEVSVTGSTNAAYLAWGVDVYSDDSAVSHAAVHAGLVQDGQTKVLYATCTAGPVSLAGSTNNGVTTHAFASWMFSFTLSRFL